MVSAHSRGLVHARPAPLAHVWCTGPCVPPLPVLVLLCASLCRTAWSTAVQQLYFKARISGSKWKNSGDVASTAKKCQEMMMETKVRMTESGAR